jgi:hypothetical protein
MQLTSDNNLMYLLLKIVRAKPLDSLLLRLAVRSLQVALADVARELADDPPPRPEPVARPERRPGRLESWLSRLGADDLLADTPATRALRRVADGLTVLGELAEDRLERLLRATLDTAIYRIDPWVVALPARRLHDLLTEGRAGLRLGAYGWVDAPRPGQPGPTAAGLIHAPSPAQALAATVLRDRAVEDPEAARWRMDLTSRTVRDADRLAEHVRIGAHLAEALGREVERVVGDLATILRLRRDFPVRIEHAGRRTCDGLAILAAPPPSLGLPAPVLAELDRLRAAVDAYGDLLVTEAIHHLTQGRAEAAGAAMDAAAGLARPPRLSLLATPREGRALATGVVVLLPAVAAPPPPADDLERAELSPAALADAAAATFLAEQMGAADTWTWTVADATAPTTSATVTLADLGLSPADALALPLADLERLVAETGAIMLGLDPGAVAVQRAPDDGGARYERAARLVGLLGRTPAAAGAVSEQPDAAVPGTEIDPELGARYARVRGTAELIVALLDAELARTTADHQIGTADGSVLGRLVGAARRWGIAPDPPPPPAGVAPPPDRLVITARRARELLAARLAAPDDSGLSRANLLSALAVLVSPTGQLAVLSRLRAGELPSLTRAGAAGAVDLDATWLPVTAAVRGPLARIEVHQLSASTAAGSGPALAAWSNKPDDPWQQSPTDNRRLVIAYAAAPLDLDPTVLPPGEEVAAALIDRFTEFVPAQEQTTAAVFGFDAPAARAPQAILLAVPPDLDVPLDPDTLLEIVAEARELAHARMARPADFDEAVRGLLPAVLLPAAGRTAVRLDPTPP